MMGLSCVSLRPGCRLISFASATAAGHCYAHSGFRSIRSPQEAFPQHNKGEIPMTSITAVAKEFFIACEVGKGWEVCKEYCTPHASFAAQAEPLASVTTLAEYTNWMKGL